MTDGNAGKKPKNTRVEIISVHVPKTAGTTFKKVLEQIYTDEEIFFDYPHRGPLRNKMLAKDSANVRVIHGHFPANKYQQKFPLARKIIWLRNPIIRLISHYFFWKSWQILTISQGEDQGQTSSIIEFAERPEMQNSLVENYLKSQQLTDFYFVGIQEFFAEDIAQLSQMLNWPKTEFELKNKNPYPEYDSLLQDLLNQKEIIAKISALNQKDLELYQQALSLREQRIKDYNFTSIGKNLNLQNSQKREKTEPILSWGFIDKAEIENQILNLSGWAASRGQGPLERLKVVICDREYTFFDQLLGIPSPDVELFHPTLDNADEARFRLKILLEQQQIEKLDRGIIALTPIFKGQEGFILLKTPPPTSPPPPQEHLNLITIQDIEELTRLSLKLVGRLLQRAKLSPKDKILEVGCSVGLAARSLSHYLEPSGSYEGFDFAQGPISWARQHLSVEKPNFRFLWENVRHPLYNPRGTLSPTDIILPYPDDRFDCAVIPYLFAHLSAPVVRHYLKQVAKVLKPGGRCLLYCFLLNHESQELIAQSRSLHNLIYQLDDGFTSDKDLPEKAIGFPESLFLDWIDEVGLTVLQKSYGSWCGRISFSGPDVFVLEKSG